MLPGRPRYGVFVDFGAVKDALLKVPTKRLGEIRSRLSGTVRTCIHPRVGRRLKKGMDVDGLTILPLGCGGFLHFLLRRARERCVPRSIDAAAGKAARSHCWVPKQ